MTKKKKVTLVAAGLALAGSLLTAYTDIIISEDQMAWLLELVLGM